VCLRFPNPGWGKTLKSIGLALDHLLEKAAIYNSNHIFSWIFLNTGIVFALSPLKKPIQQTIGDYYMLFRQQQFEDLRKEERYEHRSKVIVENLDAGPSLPGKMENFSKGGFYFESDTLIQYGTIILIGIYDSPYSDTPQTYECFRVKIKWLKELHGKKYKYGYGAELLDKETEKSDCNPHEPKPVLVGKSEVSLPKERRKHQRKSFLKPVYFVCNQKYYQGVAKDISNGGLFISTKDRLEVGKYMNIAIPNTNYDKGRMLRAQIIRIEDHGIGVKIVGILKENTKQNGSKIPPDKES
jgi:hypothetical protein